MECTDIENYSHIHRDLISNGWNRHTVLICGLRWYMHWNTIQPRNGTRRMFSEGNEPHTEGQFLILCVEPKLLDLDTVEACHKGWAVTVASDQSTWPFNYAVCRLDLNKAGERTTICFLYHQAYLAFSKPYLYRSLYLENEVIYRK